MKGRLTSMPAYLNHERALGMKVVTYFQDNPQQGLPAILAAIMLFSSATGKMIAVMDGSYVTAIRTACASAMATRALAKSETPVMFAEKDIHAEIGEILAGLKPGRSGRTELTLYKSVGIAIQDVATAHLVYRKALKQGLGTHVEI